MEQVACRVVEMRQEAAVNDRKRHSKFRSWDLHVAHIPSFEATLSVRESEPSKDEATNCIWFAAGPRLKKPEWEREHGRG